MALKPARAWKEEKPILPERRDAWHAVARRTEGRVEEGKRPVKDKVQIAHGPWRITLDTYVESNGSTTVTYTRVRSYATGWRGLKLLVRRRTWFDRVWEALGYGSRLPVSRELTDRYVVKGNPPARVPSLFSDAKLSDAVLAVPSLRLWARKASRRSRRRFGEDTVAVVCRTTGVIRDVDRLVGMIDVVRATLDALHRVGETRKEAPKEAPR